MINSNNIPQIVSGIIAILCWMVLISLLFTPERTGQQNAQIGAALSCALLYTIGFIKLAKKQ